MQRHVMILMLCTIGSSAWAKDGSTVRPPVQQVARQMQALYDRTKDLKGKFMQVYTDTLYNRKRTSYGYFYVKKPGMMRWNYVKPERKSFIADGKELWVWEPEDKQAFRNPLNTNTLSTGLTFLLGSGELSKEFGISYAPDKDSAIGGPDDVVLKLTPKKTTGQYEYLLLVLRASDRSVTQSMIVSKNSQNHFVFTQVEFDTKVTLGTFHYQPAPDTRVIDGSKIQKTR